MYPLRCDDTHQHGPHDVPPRGFLTGFRCAGSLVGDDFDRLLDKAFGPK